MNDITITLHEHQSLILEKDSECISVLETILDSDNYNPKNPNLCLGLDWANRSHTAVTAGYYVGLKWIEENKSSIYIKPKIENLDFISMFMECFNNECEDVATRIGNIYHIVFNARPICVESQQFELTSMLIIHFLK